MEFIKYQHIEKLDSEETEGILQGTCYLFYKIDGTNASVWKENGELCFGSRNRKLSLDFDNAEFMKCNLNNPRLTSFFNEYPHLRLFGEWLVPHSLKTYRNDAWRKFYVFDVMNGEEYLPYEEYKLMLEKHSIDYIPPIAIGKNITEQQVYNMLNKTGDFLIEDGKGLGEGIVIKNYNYINKYGRQTWAKVVRTEYREKHKKEMGSPLVKGLYTIEQRIIDNYVTATLIEKEYSKIINEKGNWLNNYLPILFSRVFHCLVTEELWNILKDKKIGLAKIDFKTLNQLTVLKIKETKKDLFKGVL